MLPSIKSLLPLTGGDVAKARQARAILTMPRSELENTPVGAARVQECYHPPATYDLRLSVLDELLGTHGVEGFQSRKGYWIHYLNAGDTYAPTIIRNPSWKNSYRVACWGDIAEREGAE